MILELMLLHLTYLELTYAMMARYLLVCSTADPIYGHTVDSCSVLLKEKCPWTHSM